MTTDNLALDHPWQLSPTQAYQLQKQLIKNVEYKPRFKTIRYIASISVFIQDEIARASAVVLEHKTFVPIDAATAITPVTFPYKAGLSPFREGPTVLQALKRLEVEPDLLIFNRPGLAHSQRFGLASHIALWVDIPAIGYTRSLISDLHSARLSKQRGSIAWLRDKMNRIIGAAVRVHPNKPPLYVSVGHRLDIKTSLQYFLACCHRHPLPEGNRIARHILKQA